MHPAISKTTHPEHGALARGRGPGLGLVLGLATALLTVAGCTDDTAAIDRAVDFVGGKEALNSLATFTVTASGTRSSAGEGFTPGDVAEEMSTFTSTTTYDLAGDNLRIDYTRQIEFLIPAEVTYSEIYRGNVGYISGFQNAAQNAGNTAMLSARWASGRKQARLLAPQLLLREYLADEAVARDLGEQTRDEGVFQVVELADAISPIQLWIGKDGSIARATTTVNDLFYRDLPLEIEYQGWKSFGDGVLFPQKVVIHLGSDVIHVEERSAVTLAPTLAADTFTIPADATPAPSFDAADARYGEESHQFFQEWAGAGTPLDFHQNTVQASEIASGIWFVGGGVHNSLAVEQEKGIVLVEAPFSPERSDAILAWAKRQFQGKPVSHVVPTHHHRDHAGGLRTFVSLGATIVVQDSAVELMRDVFAAPSTIVPDALAESPAEPKIQTVAADSSVTLDDAAHPVKVYPIENTHAADLVIAYVPIAEGGGVVFVSDLFNPGVGAINKVWPQELLTAINTLDGGLDVSILAGGHGATGPLSQLIDFLAGP